MKKFISIAAGAFCFLVLGFFSAKAQKATKTFSFGLGLEGGAPLGDANTAYHFTGGITIRLSYHAGPGFITLTSGAEAYVPKSGLGKSTKASLQIGRAHV